MNIAKASMILASVAGLLLLSGCAGFSSPGPGGVSAGTLVGDVTYPGYVGGHTQVQLTTADFEIVKTVSAKASSSNVLGLFGMGGNGYGQLFEEARRAGADDVINIKVDIQHKRFLVGFYTGATMHLTGTAIKWKK